MTDKLKIVGEFGDNGVAQVQSFLATLTGVQTASLLRDGEEQLPHDANPDKGNGEPEPQA
jgi:hypothetical protein